MIKINKNLVKKCKSEEVSEEEETIKEREEYGCDCCDPDSECVINNEWEDE